LALAEIVGSNSDLVASAVGNAATGLLSKSVGANDIKIDADADSAADLEHARGRYFDALLATKTEPQAAAAQASLAEAKRQYNQARRTLGLEPL
jgi:hypothetical protein